RDVGARDRSGARASVRLEDIAIEAQGEAIESLEVEHGAERSPDEALNLLRAARDFAAALALVSGERRAREDVVFRRRPAASASEEKRRHALLERRHAEDASAPRRVEDGCGAARDEAALDGDRPKAVGRVVTRHEHLLRKLRKRAVRERLSRGRASRGGTPGDEAFLTPSTPRWKARPPRGP